MFSWLYRNRLIYILLNLLAIPSVFIPNIDFLSNLSFLVSLYLLLKTKYLILLAVCIVLILKNNADYRFKLLLKAKGEALSKSDNECVYLYGWCTLLRYFLIGVAVNEIILFFN